MKHKAEPLTPGSTWENDAEQAEWYARMETMEASASKAGISPVRISRDMAMRWRQTGKWLLDAEKSVKGRRKASHDAPDAQIRASRKGVV